MSPARPAVLATKLVRQQMRQSCGSPVVVVRPSENGLRDDGLRDVDYCWLLSRDPLPDSLMGSCLVEVLLVLGDEPTKMLVIKDDHMVEDLAPCAADKSFSHGVHVRGPHRARDHPDPHALRYTVKRRSELSVAISQQDLRCFSVHCCVSQLLGCPLLGRVSAGCCVDNLARAEMHDEERIHLSEEDVIRLDEMAGPRGIRVVRQEGRPALPSMIRPKAPHVFLDRALADLDAELEQFTADALRAPQTIPLRHIAYQVDGVGAEASTIPGLGPVPPE